MAQKEKEHIDFSIVEVENRYKDYAGEVSYSGKGMVSWGADNCTPQLLYGCYNKSATLKSVIDGTVNYIKGDGIEATPKWEIVNRRGMTMREFIEHIAGDYMIFGNFAFQVIFNKLGEVKELYPLDVAKCRLNEGKTKVYYSKKGWTRYSAKSDEYDIFDPTNVDLQKPTQIFFYNGAGVRSLYNKAPWESAIYDVLTEVEATKYSLNTVSNGFSAKYVINMPENAEKTDEQKRAIEKGIQTKFCGSETSSNFAIYWGDDGKKIEVAKIESDDTPERYLAIKNGARENIFISLRATPQLFGLPNASNGFSTQEYSDSYKIFQRNVVAPIQDILIECIAKATMLDDAVKLIPYSVTFETGR